MITETLITLAINAVFTPLLVMLMLKTRAGISKGERDEKRHDGFITGLERRILALEKEVREVRIELKNRDEEYLQLYKEYTTLKAKYEVLQADHEELKKKYEHTVAELSRLGTELGG